MNAAQSMKLPVLLNQCENLCPFLNDQVRIIMSFLTFPGAVLVTEDNPEALQGPFERVSDSLLASLLNTQRLC